MCNDDNYYDYDDVNDDDDDKTIEPLGINKRDEL